MKTNLQHLKKRRNWVSTPEGQEESQGKGEENKDTFSLETLALIQFAMNVICSLIYLNINSCGRQPDKGMSIG